MPKLTRFTAIVASTAAAGLGGAVIAGAADSNSGASSNAATATTPGQDQRGPDGRGGPGGRHGGPGRGADVAAIAKSLGVTEAKLKSALEATRPDKAAKDAKKDDRLEATAAAIAKSLGESTADVKAVIESLRPAAGERPARGDKPQGTTPDKPQGTTPPAGGPRGGHRHGGPGGRGGLGLGGPGNGTALVDALVKKFSVTKEKAQAAVDAARTAHEAEHKEREANLYTELGKALDKDADEVQKAFEANKPARPAKPATPAPTTP